MTASPAADSPRRVLVWCVGALVAAVVTASSLPVAAQQTAPGGSTSSSLAAGAPATTTATTVTTTTTVGASTTSSTSTTVVAGPPTSAASTTTVAPPPTAPPAPAPRRVTAYPDQIEYILATIRYQESRGIYTLPPNKGSASGAYQFIPSTWAGYGGYEHAYLAPPEVQDERAAQDVLRFLDQWDNDVSMIPVMWYFPAAARDPALMDIVPKPEHGNILTIREYQTRWLGVFAFLSGQPLESVLPDAGASEQDGKPPELPEADDERAVISFPVLGPMRPAIPDCEGAEQVESTADGPTRADIEAAGLCTDLSPAVVFGVQLQPVLAAVDGVVTAVDDEPGSGRPISVTITAPDGRSYHYAGFNDDSPGTDDGRAPAHLRLTAASRVGSVVYAGTVIGFMGNSSPLPLGLREDVPTDATVTIDPDTVAPHVRLTIVDLDGRPVDAFGAMIDALFRQTCAVKIGPWSTPPWFAEFDPVTIETTDDDRDIDSEWVITSSGQVTASGWASQVNPNDGCPFSPADAYGPGGEGFAGWPAHWDPELDLPTDVWIELALQDEGFTPGGPLRRG